MIPGDESDRTRYGALAQAFHWLTAILVLAAFIYGPGGSEERVYSAARDFDRQLHETLGMSVFALVVMRVLWRMLDTRPDPPQVARWMGIAAKAVGAKIATLHTWLGVAILWLAGFHALASLYHHFVLKDRVLTSMLPARVAGVLRSR